MENVRYIIDEECYTGFGFHADVTKDYELGLERLITQIANKLNMDIIHKELHEQHDLNQPVPGNKRTVTMQLPPYNINDMDDENGVLSLKFIGNYINEAEADVYRKLKELAEANLEKHTIQDKELADDTEPSMEYCDYIKISGETYVKIRQALGFYKQSEIDKLQQNDNK